jgi:hypothetical protein
MSLGLNDVSKRKKPARRQAPASASGAGEGARPRPAKQRPARPWSTAGLARQGESRSEAARGAHITDEWAQLHEAPLFWIDLGDGSQAAALYERILKLEEKIRGVARLPADCVGWVRAILKST